MRYTAAVITVSDRSFRGERQDLSGPAVARVLQDAGFEVIHTALVPDEAPAISQALSDACDRAHLILTTGGTGLSRRDVTPEATTVICERLIPGIPEHMRAEGSRRTPLAALSRAIAGTRGAHLIVNLPGSPRGATESLESILHLLPHALELLQNEGDSPLHAS